MNHLTLGIYPNKSIEYNRKLRPGRLLYVDGKRVYNGLLRQEYLSEYDEVAQRFYANTSRINMNYPTIPYR